MFKEIRAPINHISEATCRIWMRYIGFEMTAASKGWYTDGHERADVVLMVTKEQFLHQMSVYESKMIYYEGENMSNEKFPTLNEGEKLVVLITHDEPDFQEQFMLLDFKLLYYILKMNTKLH